MPSSAPDDHDKGDVPDAEKNDTEAPLDNRRRSTRFITESTCPPSKSKMTDNTAGLHKCKVKASVKSFMYQYL